MSLLYYVSIGIFFFVSLFMSAESTQSSARVHVLSGWRRCVVCVPPWTAHRNICWNGIFCACLFTVKKAWLFCRLLKTQLNQMKWDCFKLDPGAVCGGWVCLCVGVCLLHRVSVVRDALKPCVSAKWFDWDPICPIWETVGRCNTIKCQ